MTGRKQKSISLRQLIGRAVCSAASAALLLLAHAASAQQPLQPQDPQTTNPPTVQSPAIAPTPGALEQVGRWIDDSVSTAGAGIGKAVQGTVGGFGGAADAATSVAKGVAQGAADVATAATRLPTSRIASGRERCTFAPNGAPDCRGAADALCKRVGFQSGTSIDFENVENCPAGVLIAGRRRTEGDCPVDYFVTKSLCQ